MSHDRLIKPRVKFTQVPNDLICSSELTGIQKAVYCYLLSRPDDWKFYTSEIAKNMKESKDTIYKALKELIKFGWIEKKQIRKANGTFSHNVFTLFYEALTVSEKTVNGKTVNGKTVNGNLATTNTNTTNTKKTNNNSTCKRENFRKFKEQFLKNIGDSFFYTSGIGWLSDTAFKIENGLIKNVVSNKIISKDESLKIWNYLYDLSNKD